MKVSLASIIALASHTVAEECCLCDGCLPLEPTREGAYVYNDRRTEMLTCENLAWNLMKNDLGAKSPYCLESQTMFRHTCCTAEPLVAPLAVRSEDASSRNLSFGGWGAPTWLTDPISSFTNQVSSFLNNPFGSSTNNNPVSPIISNPISTFTNQISQVSTPGNLFPSITGGGTCKLCDFPANGSLGIVVNGPNFQYTGPCRGLNEEFRKKGISKSHQMCGATIARFRHDCRCPGAQNNAAQYFGTAPNNSGVNTWCVKSWNGSC